MQWLRAGAVAVGLAAAVTSGSAVASASPSDSPDPGPASTTTDGADAGAADDTATVSDPKDADADLSVDEGTPRHSGDPDPLDDSDRSDADLDDADRPDADLADADSDLPDVGAQRHKSVRAASRESAADDADASAPRDGDLSVELLSNADTAAEAPARSANATGSPLSLALSAFNRPAQGVNSVAIARPAPAVLTPAVRVLNVVADALGIVGWGSVRTSDLPAPGGPVGSIVESLWLVVRGNQTKSSVAPGVAQPVDTSQTPAQIDAAALAALVARGVDIERNTDGTIDNINGSFTDTAVTDADDAAEVLNGLAPLLGAAGGFARADDITVQKVGTGDKAETFYRLEETVDGVPVLGSEVVLVTDSNGAVKGLYNYHDRGIESVDTTPDGKFDTKADAVAAARAAYLRATLSEPLGWLSLPSVLLSSYEPELLIYSVDPEDPPQLAWRVVVDPFDPVGIVFGPTAPSPGSTYVIDAGGADAGTILAETSHAQYMLPAPIRDLFTDPATVTADDVLGNSRAFNVQRLKLLPFDVDAFTDVTRNLQTHRFIGLGLPLNLFGLVVGGAPSLGGFFGYYPSAVSAHTNMAKVFDYYKNELDLNSFDGDGAPVNVVIQYNPFGPFAGIIWEFTNAYWDPANQMLVFGDGGDFEAAVDVIGHEYTHAVFTNAIISGGGLFSGGGSPENGALNEAYADILGNLIEGKTDAGQWLVGEDSAIGAIRNMADPASVETGLPGVVYPTNYADRYKGSEDGGGVHINSTIFSHAAYLMQTSAATPGVTKAEWAELYYRSLYRLSSDADMSDARDAVEDTAVDLGTFSAAERLAIASAFSAVGIS